MTYEIITPFTVKTKQGDLTLNPGQTITLAEEKAVKLIGEGKIKPIGEPKHDTLNNLNLLSYFEEKGKIKKEFESEALNERMAIEGESCSGEQSEPYVTDFGVLVIPYNSDKKYHYWAGGQSICVTLRELGRCDLIEKYKSLYSDN